MTISIRFNEEAELEDEYDLNAYQQAMQAHKEHPMTHSHDEVKKLLNFEG